MGIAAGIAKANAELGYPMNIVEGLRIAAVGAARIAAISQQRFSGAYHDGRRIPAHRRRLRPRHHREPRQAVRETVCPLINSMCAGQLSRHPLISALGRERTLALLVAFSGTGTSASGQEQSQGALTRDDRDQLAEDIRSQALIDCMWPLLDPLRRGADLMGADVRLLGDFQGVIDLDA